MEIADSQLSQNIKILKKLKEKSGSHSPSPKEIEAELGFDPIKYDYCFLSNPYATEMVIREFNKYLTEQTVFQLFESYPADQSFVGKHLSKLENLNPDYLVCGNGAVECINWVCDGWELNNLLIPLPTFSTYYEVLSNRFTFVDNLYQPDLNIKELLSEAEKNKCDSILLINPNNPTGSHLSLDQLEELTQSAKDKKIIIDESFSHFLDDYSSYINFRENCNSKNVVFIKSLSKDFGIAGLRLGYMYTQDMKLLEYAKKYTTWNLNNFAVWFSTLFEDTDFLEEYEIIRKRYVDERNAFYLDLKEISEIEVWPSQANFFLIKFKKQINDSFCQEFLLKTGIYIRSMEDKIGLSDQYVRVASRKHEQNTFFLNELKKIL